MINRLMKYVGILGGAILISCSSQPNVPENQRGTSRTSYQIVNLGPNLDQFWQQANGKPFEQQLAIWNEIVEKPNQDLYDSLVHSKKYSKNWEEKRIKRLKRFFGKLPTEYLSYKKLFLDFDSTVGEQIRKYSARFPDSRFTGKIFAVPGASFNGKSGQLSQSKENVLAFGIDVLHEMKDDTDVLYSHELFHIYHEVKLGSDEKIWDEKAKLTMPLWMEGLATYVSKEMNPERPDDKIFMSADLPKVPEKDVKWMAKEFLKNADEKSFDESKPEVSQVWFIYGQQPRKDIPTRAGYLLGYRVVAELAKRYSSYEMSAWDFDRLHKECKAALTTLAR